MAASAISSVLGALTPLIQKEVGLLYGVDKDMKKLSRTLTTILAVLDDAEIKQFQQRAIQDWLRKLKDAAYEVRDILDDCKSEATWWKHEGQRSCGSLRKVWTCYPVKNLLFRHNIGNRMKVIIEDLDAIAQERIKFQLNERIPEEKFIAFDERRETSSALTQPQVFGREDDKNHIVKVLTVDVHEVQEVSVYPIIGMGGLGKTTLAQMVLNEETIKKHFQSIIWVYVSPNFDVKRVMNLILESVSERRISEESSLDSFQKKVREVLCGKRYLLVLDDVWNEDQEEWDKLKYALSSGSPGSSILVTTRSDKVSSIMGAISTKHLSVLSEDDCWLLFRQRAFEKHNEERSDLVAVGKEIVKKCGGVPLAAKALGGLLRTKNEVNEWVNIKESDLWDLPQGEVANILPALRLRYYNLPLELRHCFSYCAVFPKGSRMEKDQIVKLWMANGFISSRGRLEMEDVGNEVWNELYKRSLFLCDEAKPQKMFMHDLVHDLARSIREDECYTMEAEGSGIISKQKVRHITFVCNSWRSNVVPEALSRQSKLHSIFLLQDIEYHERLLGSDYEFSCDFKNMGSLRVFHASGVENMKQLSDSIGISKHLTYLDLSRTRISKLPSSICRLHNLQTLNLNNCLWLERLPKKMYYLTAMRHLYLQNCIFIEATPPKLGKLTQLKTLSLFVVGESDDQGLGELQRLDLGGELTITNLERVGNPVEAREANLAGKSKLRILTLIWRLHEEEDSESLQDEQQVVFDTLEPHPNIEYLTISGYSGKEFPVWMRRTSPSVVLRNVVSMSISHCRKVLGPLPAAHWPCLKRLCIEEMDGMEYLLQNVTSSSAREWAFQSLEELRIHSIPNLKGLLSKEEGEEVLVVQDHLLPRISLMWIEECPQLMALPALPAIEDLTILGSSSSTLLASISKLTSLTTLHIEDNEDMVSLPDEMLQNLTLLQYLEIKNFKSLKVLPGNMSSLVALKKLEIDGCDDLECLPEGGIAGLRSLLELSIRRCPKIVSLPDSIQSLVALKELKIDGCEELRWWDIRPTISLTDADL